MFLKIFYYKKIRVRYFPHITFIHPPMFVDWATPRSGSERKAIPSSNWSWSADASARRDLGLTPFPGCQWPPQWHYTFRVWESLLLRNCWEGEQPNTYMIDVHLPPLITLSLLWMNWNYPIWIQWFPRIHVKKQQVDLQKTMKSRQPSFGSRPATGLEGLISFFLFALLNAWIRNSTPVFFHTLS